VRSVLTARSINALKNHPDAKMQGFIVSTDTELYLVINFQYFGAESYINY